MGAVNELASYLGHNTFQSHKLVWTPERLTKVLKSHKTWADFQSDVEALYLYASREDRDDWWLPHMSFAVEQFAGRVKTVLEYGAAIGWFGFRLMGRGFDVDFVESESRCATFLDWRLRLHGLDRTVIAPDDFPLSRVWDGVTCFDLLGRYDEGGQCELLDLLPTLGTVVVFDADVRDRPKMKGIDVPALLDYLADGHDILAHKVVNHYVHLVAYRAKDGPVTEILEE